MLSFPFTDKVFVCVSAGFQCPCAEEHSGSNPLLFPILYSSGKGIILGLSHGRCVLCKQPSFPPLLLPNFEFWTFKINEFCGFLCPINCRSGGNSIDSQTLYISQGWRCDFTGAVGGYLGCAWSIQAWAAIWKKHGVYSSRILEFGIVHVKLFLVKTRGENLP